MQDSQYPVPSFSLAERDRRWALVRSLMESAGIDILIVPDEPNSRYLTQMANDVGPTILPLEGEVTGLTGRGRVGSAALTWIRDCRPWNRRWTAGIVERLQELNADRKIVGIAGLDGLMRHPDGDLNYNTFVTLREVFSHTRWVGAGDLMQEARYVKSDEEIAFLERAARAIDAGLLAAAEKLRPGVSDREICGGMILAMAQAGNDPTGLAQLGVAPMRGRQAWAPWPVGHVAAAGDALVGTVAGRYTGYNAQGVQPVVLGPLPEDWASAWHVHLEAWQRTWQALRAGATFAEVESAVGSGPKGEFRARQTIHGCGLGDDMPLIMSSSEPRSRPDSRVLKEGVCLIVKSYATWTDEDGDKELGWGDAVVITREGARRLGARPHEVIVRD